MEKRFFTREQYTGGECTHRQYYGQFVTVGTKQRVLSGIGLKRILASTDEHFNDIPLRLWENLVPRCPGSELFKYAGDYYTLAGGVCLLKEAARQLVEEANQEV